MISPPIRLGMLGGGPDSLIGPVHRGAAALTESFRLCAGAFSSDPQRNHDHGSRLGLNPQRVYPDVAALIAGEQALPADERVEAVAVLTPNHLHHAQASALIEAGLHVMCEKPLTVAVAEAEQLGELAGKHGAVVCITHSYTGYPMVQQMKALIAAGAIGEVQKVDVQYYQGWINAAIHDPAQRSSVWRLDPHRAGPSCCFGDIGVHAFDLAEYATGLRFERLLASLDTLYEDNPLDVDGVALLQTASGVRALLRASQIATGEENNLRIAVYGRRGALLWEQERPMVLRQLAEDGAGTSYTPGHEGNAAAARINTQLPPGHPQGLVEAVANLYRGFACAIREQPVDEGCFRGIDAGIRGMRFIEAVVESAAGEPRWVDL